LKAYQRDIRNNELKTLFERENTLWNGKNLARILKFFSYSARRQQVDSQHNKRYFKEEKSELELRESESKFKMLLIMQTMLYLLRSFQMKNLMEIYRGQ